MNVRYTGPVSYTKEEESKIRELAVNGYVREIFTTPHSTSDLDCEMGLMKYLDMAHEEIVFAIYSFSLQTVADKLVQKHNSGVSVRGICDYNESIPPWSKILYIKTAGVDVIRAENLAPHLLHLKCAVIDQTYVLLGSFNWTKSAEKYNVENLVCLTSRKLAPILIDQIDQVRAKETT